MGTVDERVTALVGKYLTSIVGKTAETMLLVAKNPSDSKRKATDDLVDFLLHSLASLASEVWDAVDSEGLAKSLNESLASQEEVK